MGMCYPFPQLRINPQVDVEQVGMQVAGDAEQLRKQVGMQVVGDAEQLHECRTNLKFHEQNLDTVSMKRRVNMLVSSFSRA
jgi:hypothetical protein